MILRRQGCRPVDVGELRVDRVDGADIVVLVVAYQDFLGHSLDSPTWVLALPDRMVVVASTPPIALNIAESDQWLTFFASSNLRLSLAKNI